MPDAEESGGGARGPACPAEEGKEAARRRRVPTSEAEIIGGSTGFEPRVRSLGTGRPEAIRTVLTACAHVRFPLASEDLADRAGDVPIPLGEDRDVPFREVLAALPPARFANAAEVKEHVTRHWDLLCGP